MSTVPKDFSLKSRDNEKLIIRTISIEDIELLRVWKNRHRNRFFFKKIITPEMQLNWFQSYVQKDHDFMMMILDDNEKIGCIGFRLVKDAVDIYNVILGREEFGGKGYMANAMNLLCQEAMKRYPKTRIIASVLKTNPALQWYFRRGFVLADEHAEHVEVTLPESQS